MDEAPKDGDCADRMKSMENENSIVDLTKPTLHNLVVDLPSQLKDKELPLEDGDDYDALSSVSTSSGLRAEAYETDNLPGDDGDTDSEDSNLSCSDDNNTPWISWFCGLKGHEFFCQVDDEYIRDEFNLTGLSNQVPYYDHALDLILDSESHDVENLTDEQHGLVELSAERLYGLIHARFIITSKGLNSMFEKYKNMDFGRCPRVNCSGQPSLPLGQSDVPRTATVKIYCPKCEDIYYPRSRHQGNLDGSYFGTTFAHLFLMTYPQLKPEKACVSYVPKIFGFKIHKSANEVDIKQ